MENCFWSSFRPNDLYAFCENQLCGMVAEPANTWSNIGYLLVAILIFKNTQVLSPRVKNFFAASTLCLFFGSTAMHATGTYWGKIADVSSMFFLSNVILTLSAERFFKLKESTANLLFLLLFSFSVWYLFFSGFGGWLFMLQLIVAAGLEYRLKKLDVKNILQAVGFLAVAFAFWLLDVKKILCWPENHILTGHSLWHLLAAATIWIYFLAYREQKVTNPAS